MIPAPGPFVTYSSEETVQLASGLISYFTPGSLICLRGDLGAGKSTLAKGIISGLTGVSPDDVCSPTFVYLNVYNTSPPVYHFDLYRLQDPEEFLAMGFDDFFFTEGICIVEWPERIESLLPETRIELHLSHMGEDTRELTFRVY